MDDAIVVLENIERRIEEGDDSREAARSDANQVFFAVVATSLTLIAAVFVPLSFLQGEIGKLFREFGLTLAIAVALSTFVALSLCPVIASLVQKKGMNEGPFARLVHGAIRRLTSGYRSLLERAIRMPIVILGLAAALTSMSWTLYQELPSELTPDSGRGTFFVSVQAPAGSALGLTGSAVTQVEELLQPYIGEGVVEDVAPIVGQYGETGQAFIVPTMAP